MSFRDVCYSRRQNDCVHDQPGQTLKDYLPISLQNKQNQLVTKLPSLPINREISRKYSKINPTSRFLFATSRKRIVLSFCTRIFRFFLPAHRFASCESSTIHGKCREQPSGDYRSISNRRVCDLLAFKVNASSSCYGIKLGRCCQEGSQQGES